MNKFAAATTLSACLVFSLAVSAMAEVKDGQRKLLGVDRRIVARSAAWGVIAPLADGSLGLVVNQARPVEKIGSANLSNGSTNVCLTWMRSTDAGKTWSEPVIVSERRGPAGELVVAHPDGGYLVFQERCQALGQLPSGRIVCSFFQVNHYFTKEGKRQGRPDKAHAVAYTWSDDLGKTWVKTRMMSLEPFALVRKMHQAVAPQWRIVTLEDGTALMSMVGSLDPEYKGPLDIPEGTRQLSGVFRSTDNGQSWGDVSVILTSPGPLAYEETALCLVGDGLLLAHVRMPDANYGSVVQYASSDNGRTWDGPSPLTELGQQPAGAFQLASGKLMVTWGNRRPPFGAAAMLSRDGGKTWDYEHRVSLAWDAPGGECGYANGAQAGDGSIVVTYYVMPVTSDYRKKWTDSVVYTLRFTEEEFLAASRAP